MNHNLPPLTMAASIEVDGSEVWYAMPLTEVTARGLESHIRDTLDEGHCYVVLPLDEVDDAPRCDNCEAATLDLEWCDDSHGHGEYRCRPCAALTWDEYHLDMVTPATREAATLRRCGVSL